MVDAHGGDHPAPVFQHEEVALRKRRLGRSPGGVYAPLPADGTDAPFFIVNDALEDRGDGIDIL